MIIIIKTKEELRKNHEICQYCRVAEHSDELPPPITKFNSGCEGSYCDEAYENYLNNKKEDKMKFKPENKDYIDLTKEQGVGCFMVIESFDIKIRYNQMLIKGELFEINQDTGKPESLGEHEVNINLQINDIYDVE